MRTTMTPETRTDLARLLAQILYDRYIAEHPELRDQPPTHVATPAGQAQNSAA